MAPFFYLTSGRGGGGKILIICWMLFFRKRIPAVSQEGNIVCILTCDIFILTCHTNCFLGLDVNSTCFIYCTPTSFPLFLSDTFLPDPFFIQVLFLPSLFILNCCFAGRGHFLYPHYVTFVFQCFHTHRTLVALTLIHCLSCNPLVKFIVAY